MMFPVNRPASELTATELLNLYDKATTAAFGAQVTVDECGAAQETKKELRAEIERRMRPCDKQHYNWYQGQGQLLGQGGNR